MKNRKLTQIYLLQRAALAESEINTLKKQLGSNSESLNNNSISSTNNADPDTNINNNTINTNNNEDVNKTDNSSEANSAADSSQQTPLEKVLAMKRELEVSIFLSHLPHIPCTEGLDSGLYFMRMRLGFLFWALIIFFPIHFRNI